MATVRRVFAIAAGPGEVWSALRDFGAVHERLAAGFVVDSRPEGDDRVVTFAGGAVARERLVTIDDERRRLVYCMVESPLGSAHYNGSAEVLADGAGTRFVWVIDVLPHRLAEPIGALMDRGVAAIKKTLEAAT
jgi:carbon monoxide dehydrogenase subunit G